jgi:hypothetical protein
MIKLSGKFIRNSLVLGLCPDKNEPIATDGAFKILSKVWNVLSDKTNEVLITEMNLRGI